MHKVAIVVAAALFGAVLATTIATAGEPAPSGNTAVCTSLGMGAPSEKRAQEVISESLAAGRAHFLSIGGVICAW
jgi:hypothetical protein